MAITQRKVIQASYGVTEVEDANINRSPSSYEKNDPEYLVRYARIVFGKMSNFRPFKVKTGPFFHHLRL